ncbi:MAG: phosphoenolpyruvate--protein phosphotransferase, partial [Spirochaetaceae bacterium]|nr:phosphoenolpyruvate--protein phosphotransferase [Spirochaetaceae bacterium]
MKKLTGIPTSPGIAAGKAFLHMAEDFQEILRYTIEKTRLESEWRRFLDAVAEAGTEIRALHEWAKREMTKEQADIFMAHLMMLEDPDFQARIKGELESSLQNIEWVVWEISRQLIQKLITSPDAYLRERAEDISDVSNRIIHKLLAITKVSLADLSEDVILVAHDLLPSDLLSMNKNRVKGIVMDMGGRTSHTAILARAFGIPAVLGLSSATREINNGDTLMVDGGSGQVTVDPDQKTLSRYKGAVDEYNKKVDELLDLREFPAETRDGHRVCLKANIEIPEEAGQIHRYGAEGIGLYRSEFL